MSLMLTWDARFTKLADLLAPVLALWVMVFIALLIARRLLRGGGSEGWISKALALSWHAFEFLCLLGVAVVHLTLATYLGMGVHRHLLPEVGTAAAWGIAVVCGVLFAMAPHTLLERHRVGKSSHVAQGSP